MTTIQAMKEPYFSKTKLEMLNSNSLLIHPISQNLFFSYQTSQNWTREQRKFWQVLGSQKKTQSKKCLTLSISSSNISLHLRLRFQQTSILSYYMLFLTCTPNLILSQISCIWTRLQVFYYSLQKWSPHLPPSSRHIFHLSSQILCRKIEDFHAVNRRKASPSISIQGSPA